MELLEPEVAPRAARSMSARPWTRSERRTGWAVGAVGIAAFVLWEIARPTLPVPFELAGAARSPGTAPWVGRLPMALAALGGMLALYIFLTRTAERRTASYAVAVLATMPAWFVHGRLMTGAIVPMACSATVLAGLGIALLDPRASGRIRALGAAAAIAAAVLSLGSVRWGVPNRGLLPVVGVPLIAALAATWMSAAGPPHPWRRGALAAILIVAVSLALALVYPSSRAATLLLGARSSGVGTTTFDAPVATLAYGLVPWTPFLPFALARRPTNTAHLAVMIAAGLAIVTHALLAPRMPSATFLGIAALAAAVAMMLRTLEDVRRPAATLIATVIAIGWLVAHDFGVSPERALVAFGASDAAVPSAQATASSLALRSSIWLCTLLAAVALAAPRAWLPSGRGLAIVAAGVLAGLVLRAHAYPELLMRLSPGAAFETWAQRHREGEPLGLVGLDRRTLAFAPATAVAPQPDPRSAGAWLAASAVATSTVGAAAPRRFLALGVADLPAVNASFREARGANVPVLAGRGGTTLLAASALANGERSDNPLDAIVLAARPLPAPQHAIDAVLEDRLDAVGWELRDDDGALLDAIPKGSRHAHVRLLWRARTGGLGAHCTFLHVDHAPSRFSAEHREQTYPLPLWRDGDVVVDDYDVKLPAAFRSGSYRLFFGVGILPCEDDRRLHVTSGPTDGHDRIVGGALEVR